MDKYKDVKYWVEKYNQRCQGDRCTRVGECVMNLWDQSVSKGRDGFPKKLQYDPLRMHVLEEIAKITIEANTKIEKIFEEAHEQSGRKVPEKMPVFSLDLFDCPSQGYLEIDYGD